MVAKSQHAFDQQMLKAVVLLTLLLRPASCFNLPKHQLMFRGKPVHVSQGHSNTIPSLKSKIEKAIASTNRGVNASPNQQSELEDLLLQLESVCPLNDPARDPRMEGKWKVEYSTAPPPSNGQLGPFLGSAYQIIDLENGSYINKLEVDPNEWLSAELRAKWFEWDGTILEDDSKEKDSETLRNKNDFMEEDIIAKSGKEYGLISSLQSLLFKLNSSLESSTKIDHGATSWRVDFESLSIRLFGLPIVKRQFENTSRVWRMSYLDDNVRIVRAGRTGKSEDEVVFYMTRENDKDL